MRNTFFFISALAIIMISSCKTDNKYEFDKKMSARIADSIMYAAIVKNPNPEEKYMDEWLKDADIKVLSNIIFKAVYDKRLTAYNYITGEKLSIEEVKELEEEYMRDNIGKILFTEEWYFDEENLQMHKKVNSIMLAYERRDEENIVYSYKAGIRIYLNGTKPMKPAINYDE